MEKFLPSLCDKDCYGVHYKTLQLYLSLSPFLKVSPSLSVPPSTLDGAVHPNEYRASKAGHRRL